VVGELSLLPCGCWSGNGLIVRMKGCCCCWQILKLNLSCPTPCAGEQLLVLVWEGGGLTVSTGASDPIHHRPSKGCGGCGMRPCRVDSVPIVPSRPSFSGVLIPLSPPPLSPTLEPPTTPHVLIMQNLQSVVERSFDFFIDTG